jgi:hypothetical protein
MESLRNLEIWTLTNAERDALKTGLRSSDAFTLRRSQPAPVQRKPAPRE